MNTLKLKAKQILNFLAPFGFYYLMMLVVAFSIYVFMETDNPWFNVLHKLFLFIILTGWYFKKEPVRYIPKPNLTYKSICLIMLSGSILSFVLNLIITYSVILLAKLSPAKEQIDQAVQAATYNKDMPLACLILSSVILAPLLEELLFRGLLLQRASRNWSKWPSVIIVALLFAIYHGNPIQGIYAFLMGLIMCLLAYRYKALLPSILFHFSANLTIVILGLI